MCDGPPVLAVRGNVDEPALASLLPERAEFEAGGRRCGILHAAGAARGRVSRLRRLFPGCDAVVFGHSHIPLHELDEGFQVFNPGARRPGAASPVTRWDSCTPGPPASASS